jgi:hypothetical protein
MLNYSLSDASDEHAFQTRTAMGAENNEPGLYLGGMPDNRVHWIARSDVSARRPATEFCFYKVCQLCVRRMPSRLFHLSRIPSPMHVPWLHYMQ